MFLWDTILFGRRKQYEENKASIPFRCFDHPSVAACPCVYFIRVGGFQGLPNSLRKRTIQK